MRARNESYMGSPLINVATNADATLAISKGGMSETSPLISTINKTPVSGARTTEVKSAAIPTIANAVVLVA